MSLLKSILIILSISTLTSCASKKVQSSNEKKADIYYAHGTQKLISKDYTDALNYLKQAAKLDPSSSRTFNNLGMAYYFKKRNDLALKHLEKSLELDPKNSDARNNLASIYYEMGQLSKAKKQYELILEDLTYPHQYRTHYNLGLIFLKQNEKQKAVTFLTKATDLKKDYCAANYQLGIIYKGTFKYHKALNAFKDASKGTCTNNPEPHFQWALTLKNLHMTDHALKKFLEIQENFPESKYVSLAKREISLIKEEEMFTHQQRSKIRRQYYKANNQNNDVNIESPKF